MADNDDQLLENARKAAQKVDIRYKAANLDGKVMLKSSRDKLFSAYAAARRPRSIKRLRINYLRKPHLRLLDFW
jgi:hypothetical protein